MTRKQSVPTISEEELNNRRCQFARILFLEQLDATCPQVREDLLNIWRRLEPRIREAITALQDQFDDEFDAVREKFHAEHDRSGMGNVSISGPTVNVWSWYGSAPQDPDTLRSELEATIRGWAHEYGIEANWVINTAIENITRWHQYPALEDEQRWLPPSVGLLGSLPPEAAEFQFRLPRAWEPMFEKPAAVRKRITKAFKKELNEWIEKTQKLAQELGFHEIRERPELKKHVGWLIRHRVLGQGFTEIARADFFATRPESGRGRVTSGIESASKLIGFDSI